MRFWSKRQKSSPYVDMFYVMNPETEDLLPNGLLLKNGMVILIEERNLREDIFTIENSPYAEARALENNRWCTVTNLEFRDRRGYDNRSTGKTVWFVAVYEDGTKRSRELGSEYSWLVKLDSIPQEIDETV